MALLPGQIVGALAPVVGRAGAAGIAWNTMQESSNNPADAGGGLAQWQGSRYQGLLNFARGHGLNPSSGAAALGYLKQDLSGPYAGLAAQLRGVSDPSRAADLFSSVYERPGIPMLGNRERYAQQAFGAAPSSPGAVGSSGSSSYTTSGFNTQAAEEAGLLKSLSETPKPFTGENLSSNVGGPLGAIASEMSNPAFRTSTTHTLGSVTPSSGLADLHPHGGGYVNPVGGDTVRWERTDQGVDAALGTGQPIRAIGNAKVMGVEPNWYNGQPMLWYQLLDGPDRGKYVFVAEQIDHLVKPGTIVRAGDPVARYAPSGTGIETGWAVGSGQTLARATTGYTEGEATPAGMSFRHLLDSLGAKA